MKKRLITVAVAAVVIFLLALPKMNWFKGTDEAKLAPGQAQGGGRGGKLSVDAIIIKPAPLDSKLNVTGSVLPNESLELKSEVSGKIITIFFREGKPVHKGDTLIQMNDDEIEAQLEKQKYNRKLNEDNEFRQRKLLEKDAISQESYDQIVTELQTIEADINLIQARISETELRAPFDGIIGLRYLSEGSYATSATKIAKLIKISPLKIEFSIPEKYASEIRIGYPVSFTVDGMNKILEASVYAVDPKIDIETRTIVLRALYPNKNEELKSGRYASIKLVMSEIENAVSIPTEALIPEMDGEKVFLYKAGKASSVKVQIGLRTESRIQITEGLSFGDTLLITGILQLRQNLPVVLDTLIKNN